MADAPQSERRSAAEPPALGDPLPYDEDFLYHLSRGSELLIENRVVEAKDELERALGFQPQDAKGQDLLAGVYFRLGVYPRAIELWSALALQHADDVALRVNLGLALLKTAQPELALEHLARALAKEPEHERAWRYVGLAEWRVGNLDRAREAFLRGGQASMARRMEELLESSRPAPASSGAAASHDGQSARDAAAVRALASDAIEKLGAPEPSLSVAASSVAEASLEGPRARRTTSQWRVVEQGVEAMPRPIVVEARPPVVGPALGVLLRERNVIEGGSTALRIVPGGSLCVRTDGAVISRRSGLRALRGPVPGEPIVRRSRTTRDEGTLGDRDAMLRWAGPVVALFAPPSGEHFMVLRLEGEVLFLAERYVFAFDEALTYDTARLVGDAGPYVLQFRGHGTVAVRLERAWSALPVEERDEARVSRVALLGWLGRIFPSPVEDDPDGAFVRCRGEGTLLLT